MRRTVHAAQARELPSALADVAEAGRFDRADLDQMTLQRLDRLVEPVVVEVGPEGSRCTTNGRRALARRRRAAAPKTRSALRLEAEAAAADPDDLAEVRRVRAEMDAIAATSTDAE
jgi:hypothetical protein